jgi:hypothetical protein
MFFLGTPTWSIRGLLDFNLAFGRYPDGLPKGPGAYPPDPPGAAFTLLQEGDAWLDEEHRIMLLVEKVAGCGMEPQVRYRRHSEHNVQHMSHCTHGAKNCWQVPCIYIAIAMKTVSSCLSKGLVHHVHTTLLPLGSGLEPFPYMFLPL